MAKLQLAVFSWAAQRASSQANKGIKFFVSGADREGEGEFKIYQHLMDIEFIQDFGNIATVDKARVPGPKDSVLLLGTYVAAGDSTIEPCYTGLMFHLFLHSDSDLVVSSFRLQILKNIDVSVMRMITRREMQMVNLRQLYSLMFGDLHGDPCTSRQFKRPCRGLCD
jgi:hypothetical protein